MKNEPNRHFRVLANGQGDAPTSKPAERHLLREPVARAGALGALLTSLCRVVAAQGDSPTSVRQYRREK